MIVFEPYGTISLPLVGTYQPKNAAVAIAALELLRDKGYKISASDIVSGLAEAHWPGRFEVLGRNPAFILDGAHNPQGMKATADSLRSHFGDREIVFIIGVSADKDVDSMLGHVAPMAKSFITVRSENPRAMDPQALADMLSRYGTPVSAAETIDDAVARALERAGSDGIVCALGSLFLYQGIRKAFFEMLF